MLPDSDREREHLDASNIDEALQLILESEEFHGALQLQALLRFIVEKSVAGHDDALKERLIGMSVFGRRPDYETADDPIVRSRVRQLRKRLALYYENQEDSASPVQIVIPKGTYKPVFTFRPHGVHHAEQEPVKIQVSAPSLPEGGSEDCTRTLETDAELPARRPFRRIAAILAAVALVGIGAAFLIAKSHSSNLSLFWQPLLSSNKTVIVYSGSTQVYLPTSINNYYCLTDQPGDCDKPAVNGGPRLSTPGEVQPATALTLVPYRYVRSEVIETSLKVAGLLNAHHARVESRVEPNLPYIDLRGTPVVLLGAYNNNWTLELTQDLPFFFDRDGRIHEHSNQQHAWSTPPAKDDQITQDYALVARLMNSKVGGPVIVIAGITVCGTQAAADFATSPDQLQKLDIFPRDALREKNLEFVLHTSLINCNPTSQTIEASRFW